MRFYKVAVGVVAFAAVSQSQAITILSTFVSNGNALPVGGNAGPAGSLVGGGSLTSVFEAAADYWETLIGDDFTVHITYGWQALGGGTLGLHNLLTQGGAPNRELTGQIRFDNTGGSPWFADANPLDNSEYNTYNESFSNLGGGSMNVGRNFTDATGNAAGRFDLFSVALHEIGHSLGLSSANTAFQAGNGDLDVDVTSPRLFAGSSIPTVNGAHLNIGSALMYPFVSLGERNLPSDADIIANMQISQFSQFGAPVPEPASMAALGLGVLAIVRRKKARK